MSSIARQPRCRRERPAIYGRKRNRARLRALLDSTITGHGALVLISGEAGIGKTTLVNDLIYEACERDCLVLTGGCYDLTVAPPYGPWAEVIRGYLASEDQPEIPDWWDLEVLEKLGSQTAIFAQVSEFFASIARQQPLVIVLEDFHWADQASIDALRHLARTLRDEPVLLLATYRNDEPDSNQRFFETLPALVRESDADRIALRRWSKAGTRTLLANRYRLNPDDEDRLTTHIHRLAEGNPFYTVELLHELVSDATLQPQADTWLLGPLNDTLIPSLIRQVIEQRLQRLSPEIRSLLELAAVIGQEVPFDLWLEASKTSEAELTAMVEEMLSAQIVDELVDGSGVAFRHALIRQTLYESITSLRRRSIHRHIGEQLIKNRGTNPDPIADHLSRAGDSRAVDWLIAAANRAENLHALIVAADRLIQAYELMDGDAEHVRDCGWLAYRIGRLMRQRNTPLALEYFETSLALGIEATDEYLQAASKYQRGFMLCWLKNYRDGIDLMLDALPTLDRLKPTTIIPALALGPYTGGHVDSGYIVQIMNAGRFREGVPILESHVEKYGEHGQLDLMMACYDALSGKPLKSREGFYRAIAWHDARSHYHMAALDRGLLLQHLLLPYYTDHVDEIRLWYGETHDVWQKAAEGGWIGYRPPRSLCHADFLSGHWQLAADQARLAAEDTEYTIQSEDAISCLAMLALHRGNFQDVENLTLSVLVEGAASTPGNYRILSALDLLKLAPAAQLASGDLEAAREWLEAHDRWLAWSGAVLGQAEGQLLWARYFQLRGDMRLARERVEQALAHASEPRQPLALIASHRFLGELDTIEQNFEAANRHLMMSAKLAEPCQAPYEIALTDLARAELELAMKEATRATALVDQARETFERLGADPALERADQLTASIATETHGYPAGLTPREVEVLGLVAEGLSNREIAEQLYLSIRTVERHISNIYNKIGSANRIDAVTFAHRHSLVDTFST